MEDIVPAKLDAIMADFKSTYDRNWTIQGILEKAEKGTATHADLYTFSKEIGSIWEYVYTLDVTSEGLPDQKMYYNIAKRLVEGPLKYDYELINGVSKQVQNNLNQRAHIGLKAVDAPFNQDRVDGIIERLANADNYDDVSWLLGDPVINFSQNVVDEFIKVNVEAQFNAGLNPKIVRRMNRPCCKWCASLAGAWNYPDDIPDDLFRRHENCDCVVEYDPGDGRRQDVHTKEWRNKTKRDDVLDKLAVAQGKVARGKDVLGTYLARIKDNNKVFITDQAIEKVKVVSPKGLTQDNASFMQATHRQILKHSRSQNYSNEVGAVIDLGSNTSTKLIDGDAHSVDIFADADAFHMIKTGNPMSLAVCHNHPGDAYFSLNDINMFMGSASIKTMTIVTNRGKVWYINKTEGFDIQKAIEAMRKASENETDKTIIVEKFLKLGYDYGVERN